jgi:anthranilate phosphoribosyltransferase
MATLDSDSEPERDVSLKQLMTEVVGSGPKSAEDMTGPQARGAMERILDGEPDPTTLGAFWLANRWKRNTPEELAAFLDATRERTTVATPGADPVDCGANYDGKRDSALLGVGAGLVSAAAGVPVVAHSGDRVPTHHATAYKHVLDELSVPTDLAPADSARMVDEVGFGFYYQPRFASAIDALLDRREQMGVRTYINTIETLQNPAGASVHLGSFYHLTFAERVIDTLARSETSEFERVCMFQGLEGYDDIRPGYTKVAEWRADPDDPIEGDEDSDVTAGSLTDYEIETAAYGMDIDEDDLAVESVESDSAGVTEAVLRGEREGAFADAIALNAAVRIYAGGGAETIEGGLDRAREAIENGEAAARLDSLAEFTPEESA